MAKRNKAKPCRYCENPVAPNAKRCPKCGGKNPFPDTGANVVSFLMLVGIVVGIWWAVTDDGHDANKSTTRTPQQDSTADLGGSEDHTPLPDYTIIDSHKVRGIKRSLDIRLQKKVDEDVLEALAIHLKNLDSSTYQRTFICYYLPSMEVGAGGWATTHFNPDLKVEILGLTAREEQRLATEIVDADRDIVGRWTQEMPYISSVITIYFENGKPHYEERFKDGSVRSLDITEVKSALGQRFDPVKTLVAGEHWIVVSDGSLHVRDRQGLIVVAQPEK